MTPALEIKGLSSGYGEALVLRDLSLMIQPGEIFALLGKNGMGKSTLLKTIMGFLPVRDGNIQLAGDRTANLPPYRMARRSVAYIPQEKALFQDLTVLENLKLVMPDTAAIKAELERTARWFPVLQKRVHQRAGTLSGGEQKMLLMVRAMLPKQKLMLIDEISEGLQPSMVDAVSDVLRTERASRDVAILLVEQNVPFVSSVADRFSVLKQGEIVASGSMADADASAVIDGQLSV